MKPEQKDVALWAVKAGKTERIAEFQYPYIDGFYVQIAYGSRFILNQIRQLAAEPYMDRRTRTQEEKLDDEKLQLGYAERIVKGWRGLTVAQLDRLIPGTVDEAVAQYEEEAKKNPDFKVPSEAEIAETIVEYSIPTAASILGNSIDFMNWVVDTAGDSNRYSGVAVQKQEKKEFENLKK